MKHFGNITAFFSEQDSFSNWFCRPFTVHGTPYCCMEQFMMHRKALAFGDQATAARIMQAQHPRDHKNLGRQVAPYDDTVWTGCRERIVFAGLLEKFRQNPDLAQALLDTGTTLLVEASPYDKVWGAGVGQDDPRLPYPEQWPGDNLLGKLLMLVRIALQNHR